MQVETIRVVLPDGSEAVINKSDFDAERHTAAEAEAPKKKAPAKRRPRKKAAE